MAEDVHGRKTARQAFDPVCKMVVDVDADPVKLDHGGHSHFFCSEKCKEEFLKDPKKYH
jgi:YHS domain-containing protein